MKIPVDKLTGAFKMGASVKKDSDTPVRVSVYLDSTASRFLVETVRDALGRTVSFPRPIPTWCWSSRADLTAWRVLCRSS